MPSIFPFSLHIVKGHSMQPSIAEGGRVVVFKWAYFFSSPKVGDIVVFRGGDGKSYVKRIAADKDGGFVVAGDNFKDSKDVPPVGKKQIVGKVFFTY